MLYKEIKKYGFDINIVDFILSLPSISIEDKEMIKREKPFAYIYLIFDYDPQHYDLSKPTNVNRGLNDLFEMLSFFNNETDPTIGKLYINYPMIESFRDCSLKDKESLKERKINLKDCSKYKEIVNKRGFQTNIYKLTNENINYLINMNLCKANYILENKYEEPTYNEYMALISQENIFHKEKELILKEGTISILHASFFIFVDYFGKSYFCNKT